MDTAVSVGTGATLNTRTTGFEMTAAGRSSEENSMISLGGSSASCHVASCHDSIADSPYPCTVWHLPAVPPIMSPLELLVPRVSSRESCESSRPEIPPPEPPVV